MGGERRGAEGSGGERRGREGSGGEGRGAEGRGGEWRGAEGSNECHCKLSTRPAMCVHVCKHVGMSWAPLTYIILKSIRMTLLLIYT